MQQTTNTQHTPVHCGTSYRGRTLIGKRANLCDDIESSESEDSSTSRSPPAKQHKAKQPKGRECKAKQYKAPTKSNRPERQPVCTEHVRQHFNHAAYLTDAPKRAKCLPTTEEPGLQTGSQIKWEASYSAPKAPVLMKACNIDVQGRSIQLEPGMVVALKDSTSADPIHLVTSIFRRTDDQGKKHVMIQVRDLVWARSTLLGGAGCEFELFLTRQVRSLDASHISAVIRVERIKAPQDRTQMNDFVALRKRYKDSRTLYYSHLYDERIEALVTPNPNTKPFNHYFLSDIRGNILEVDSEKKLMSSPMSTLDLFGGCGAFVSGFIDASLADSDKHWAVDSWDKAVESYSSNFPTAKIIKADCGEFLLRTTEDLSDKIVLNCDPITKEAAKQLQKELIPSMGSVDLIIAGPPCQGFSTLNQLLSSINSRTQRGLLLTCLSTIEVYKPALAVIENVAGMARFHEGGATALERALACLHGMGYQVRAASLNARNYGTGQCRTRLIILAAVPWIQLPSYPLMTHHNITAPPSKLNLAHGRSYCPNFVDPKQVLPAHSARDMIADLPVTCPQLPPGNTYDGTARYQGLAQCEAAAALRNEAHVTLHACKKISDEGQEGVLQGDTMKKARPDDALHQSAPCITCSPHWNSLSGGNMHYSENRYYSVRECLRLQGLPDDFTVSGSLTDMYMLVGNVVPRDLSYRLACECKKAVMNL